MIHAELPRGNAPEDIKQRADRVCDMTTRSGIFWAAALLAAIGWGIRRKRRVCAIGSTSDNRLSPTYLQFYHRGKRAVRYLLRKQKGECRGALFIPGYGDIDLGWGEVLDPVRHTGYGLAHIIEKHGEYIRYRGVKIHISDFLPLITMFGVLLQDLPQYHKKVFGGEKFRFVIQEMWRESNGRRIEKRWMLTAYDYTR